MRWIALTLALVAIVGCAAEPSDVAPLWIDPAFTGEERAAIGAANARWDAVARPWSGDGWRLEVGEPPHNAAGWCYSDERRIVIRPGHDARSFEIAITHELGHARGLDHVRNGVMQGGEGVSGASSATFSEEDIAECRRVHACD